MYVFICIGILNKASFSRVTMFFFICKIVLKFAYTTVNLFVILFANLYFLYVRFKINTNSWTVYKSQFTILSCNRIIIDNVKCIIIWF